MILDAMYDVMLVTLYLMLTSLFLLVSYALLSSLWYSLSSCWDRVRDYLGQVNKS